jgi:integrase
MHVRREKQDQEGVGRWIGLPAGRHEATCPVRALRAWLEVRRGSAAGALFTHLHSPYGRLGASPIFTIVKQALRKAGIEPAGYGPHSLRAGFVTEAVEAGAGELLIAAQTGHRSMQVLRRYFRRRDLFKANACGMLGL